jgi:hypothetical protein
VIVIGFGHRARQGKNTAALAVLESLPLDCQVRMYAFGDALRWEVRKACIAMGGQWELIKAWKEAGIMPEWVEYEDNKPRSLLQWWGTEYRRSKDPDYWVKRLRKTLDAQRPEVALISDVRFPNEAEVLREWGGYSVKVKRLGVPDVPVHEHASESALDSYTDWDYFISAATVGDCQKQARDVYGEIVRVRGLCRHNAR